MVKMESWMKMGWMALAAAALMMAGCETATMDNQGTVTLAELQGITPAPAETNATTDAGTTTDENPDSTPDTTTTDTTTGTTTNSMWPSEITGPITWLHTDVSRWAVTASLDASIGGGSINMPYSKSKVWPAVDGCNANPWVIVKWTDGKWYAATFEYLRVGQTSKPVGVLDGSKGDHIKRAPLSSWRPHSGERFGIMVSGLARSSARNVQERSNVDMVTWP